MGATTSLPIEDRKYSPELLEAYASLKDRPFLREILEAIPPAFAITTRLHVRNDTTLVVSVYHPNKAQPYAKWRALKVVDIVIANDCRPVGSKIVTISQPVYSGEGDCSHDVNIVYRLYSGSDVPEIVSVIQKQCK
jgi:hypothetical protein